MGGWIKTKGYGSRRTPPGGGDRGGGGTGGSGGVELVGPQPQPAPEESLRTELPRWGTVADELRRRATTKQRLQDMWEGAERQIHSRDPYQVGGPIYLDPVELQALIEYIWDLEQRLRHWEVD